MTQPADSASLSWTIAFLRTGANSDAKRGLEVVSLRVEVSCSKCEWDFSLSVGNHAFPSCVKAAKVKLPEGRASQASILGFQNPPVTTALQDGFAFLSSSHSMDGAGGGGSQLNETAVGAVKAPPALGKVGQGTI